MEWAAAPEEWAAALETDEPEERTNLGEKQGGMATLHLEVSGMAKDWGRNPAPASPRKKDHKMSKMRAGHAGPLSTQGNGQPACRVKVGKLQGPAEQPR